MDYQKLILVGNATGDAERKTSKKGDVTYTTFSVGVGDAKDQTTFFPVVVFGRHGEAVAKYVTKGREVLVDGRIEVGENGRFNVIGDRVRFGVPAQKARPAKKNKPAKKKKK
jgi:single-stranded DNA-binding protein